MNTNHLQSIKQANKQTINVLQKSIKQGAELLRQIRKGIKADKAKLTKKVDQQKQVKADISAAKVARPAGSRRKHNKNDPRYVAWYTSSHAARNAGSGEYANAAAPAAVNIANIPVPVACGC